MRTAWLLCIAAGCALTSKAPPLDIRYFSPVAAIPPPVSAEPVHGRVRLGRVTSASHLRYRIAHRRSPVELELSETQRWAEQPEDYVRRSLEHALFARGIELAVTGEALAVTIEVTAFEDVERGGRHLGRVQLHYTVDDDVRVVAEDVVTAERPAASGDIAHVVTAIGDALATASAEVANRIASRLATMP